MINSMVNNVVDNVVAECVSNINYIGNNIDIDCDWREAWNIESNLTFKYALDLKITERVHYESRQTWRWYDNNYKRALNMYLWNRIRIL